jgi:hypothetical protein
MPQLEESDYRDLATCEIFAATAKAFARGIDLDPEYFREHLTDDEDIARANDLFGSAPRRASNEPLDEVLREAENCVMSLREMAIAHRTLEISREAAIAERAGNTELFNQLTYEQLELETIRRELKRQLAAI